ncbi:hypothetical protein KSP39_PZI010501 [Platanthera zijinensis]|uniref:SWIM-type domain-containing protein n=1 Tax=Platanthera zijinensis TaxID=2320716 RepID=A0AAP0BI24_9ASPA
MWINRTKDASDCAFYMPFETSLFTIRMHHSGSFIGSANVAYIPDVINYIDYCNADEIVLHDLHEMAINLGHNGWVRFFCCLSGRNDCSNLLLLDNDEVVKNLIQYINLKREVDVYVEIVEALAEQEMLGGNDDTAPIIELQNYSDSVSNEDDSDDTDSTFTDGFQDGDYDSDDLQFDENIDEAVEWVGCKEPTQIIEPNSTLTTTNSKRNKSTHCQIFQGDAGESYFEFQVGLCFNTAQDFRDAVRTYSNMQGRPIKFTKNCSDKVQVTCECGWVMYAAFISKNDHTFQVKTIRGQHTCYRTPSSKHCTSDYLANKYQHHLRSNPEWPVCSMQETMQMENRTSLSIWKMYRTKKHANKIIHGTELEQYASLWDYCEEIRQSNSNTTVKLQCKQVSENQACVFKRLYICWGALKMGFIAGCRPIIGLDGTHLKTSTRGVLLCAVGIDGNNGMYPIAYAMVLRENRKTWQWFITLLMQDLNIVNQYAWTIISDKQKGLIRAVEELLPNAEHRFCLRHMYSNFKQLHKGLQLKTLLWKAASSTRVVDFNREMKKLKEFNNAAYEWVRARDPKNWARSHFSTWPKCDMLLNNLCESFNNVILKARDKPIITMLEIIRIIMMRRIHTQREKIFKSVGDICPAIQKIIENNKKGVQDYILEWNGKEKFEVKGWAGDIWIVDLTSQSCSCRKWDLSGIPCVHAIACIFFKREKVEDYVDHWFKKTTFLKAYDHMLNPIKGQGEWPRCNLNLVVPWNTKPKLRGRPSKHARRKDEDEKSNMKYGINRIGTKYSCSNCGLIGHNKKSCGQSSKETEPPLPTKSRLKLTVSASNIFFLSFIVNINFDAFKYYFNLGEKEGRTFQWCGARRIKWVITFFL